MWSWSSFAILEFTVGMYHTIYPTKLLTWDLPRVLLVWVFFSSYYRRWYYDIHTSISWQYVKEFLKSIYLGVNYGHPSYAKLFPKLLLNKSVDNWLTWESSGEEMYQLWNSGNAFLKQKNHNSDTMKNVLAYLSFTFKSNTFNFKVLYLMSQTFPNILIENGKIQNIWIYHI